MYSQVEQLCVDGDFDKIHDSLIFLVSMGMMTESMLSDIFAYAATKGKTAELSGLLELSDWIQHIWISYIKYNKLPKNIIQTLSAKDLPHISSNYISYLGSSEAYEQQRNKLDTKEFDSLASHLLQFYPQLPITSQLVAISAKLKHVNFSNKDVIVQLLYEVSRGLDFSGIGSSLSSVIKQKIKSQLNKVRLQLETLPPTKREDDFAIFLREEGIADTVATILRKLEIPLEADKP